MPSDGSGREASKDSTTVTAADGTTAANSEEDGLSEVYLAVRAARSNAHLDLIVAVQAEVIAPLVSKQLVMEFKVLTASPPSFEADAASLLILELKVPSPWPVSDEDVQLWQRSLGPDVRLAVVSPTASLSQDDATEGSWHSRQLRWHARWVLERAMALSPFPVGSESKGLDEDRAANGTWLADCLDRASATSGLGPPERRKDCPTPALAYADPSSGRMFRLASGGTTLSPQLAHVLAQSLPLSLQWKGVWRLVYSPRLHGVSLQTFFRCLQSAGPSLMVVQDHRGFVFGGFGPAEWHMSNRYFGHGESFVFRCRRPQPKVLEPLERFYMLDAHPDASACPDKEQEIRENIAKKLQEISQWRSSMQLADAQRAGAELPTAEPFASAARELGWTCNKPVPQGECGDADTAAGKVSASTQEPDVILEGEEPTSPCEEALDSSNDPHVRVYRWSGKDPFFMFSDGECLAMGGGSGFAFYLEKDLLHGVSEPCSTFASKMLSSSSHFAISNLECWVFEDTCLDGS